MKIVAIIVSAILAVLGISIKSLSSKLKKANKEIENKEVIIKQKEKVEKATIEAKKEYDVIDTENVEMKEAIKDVKETEKKNDKTLDATVAKLAVDYFDKLQNERNKDSKSKD